METVIGLLLVGSLFVALFWAGAARRHVARPVPVRPAARPTPYPRDVGPAATALAIARADRIAGLGRHDDRRCAH